MQKRNIAAWLFAGAAALSSLCGCTDGSSRAETSGGEGLWLGIEPAAEDEFGKVTYEDGLYLSQTVKDPVPDPYEDDTKLQRTGTTDDGIRFALYKEHAEITGHSDSFDVEELEIPETISDLPVTKIVSVEVAENSVLDIDVNGAFYGCYSLASVKIPEGVREIGNYAFYGCKNLKEVELPESVMHIGDRAFAMCSTLTAMNVPSGIDTIGDSAFSLTPWYDDLLYHRDLIIFNGRLYDAGRRCTGDIVIPDYVVSVGDYAFYSCIGLETVVIPKSVQSVGKYAFCDCPGLYAVLFLNPECEVVRDASTISNKVTASNKDFYKGIIFGEPDSTAQSFAKKLGYRFEDTNEFYSRQQERREKAAKMTDVTYPDGAEIFSPEDIETETEAKTGSEDESAEDDSEESSKAGKKDESSSKKDESSAEKESEDDDEA